VTQDSLAYAKQGDSLYVASATYSLDVAAGGIRKSGQFSICKAGRLFIYGEGKIFPSMMQLGESLQRFLQEGLSLPVEITNITNGKK
jgi:hypothetical protein